MRIATLAVPTRILLIYGIGAILRSAVAMEEQLPASMPGQRIGSALNVLGLEEPAEKRAYTYVSEYKRLPVYNFGIGKRWADNEDKRGRQYSFGLGKRTRPYSFGLGKRNNNNNNINDPAEYRMSLDYPYDGLIDGLHSREAETLDDFLENKRSRQPYSFGLGKRASWSLAAPSDPIGTGKRPNDVLTQRYHFGLGKRVPEDEEAIQ